MPPIPIYTSSPINATKASGVTPQTAGLDEKSDKPTTVSGPAPTKTYPAAQPGAVPSLPVQTATAYAPQLASPAPTRTNQDKPSGPAPPQPGAVPVAPGGVSSTLPPPPRAGEVFNSSQHAASPQHEMPMPHQMTIPPPMTSYGSQQGSSTATNLPQPTTSRPVNLGSYENLSHPPGYHQNTSASEFSSDQRAAHQASMREGSTFDNPDDNVWDQAKKWASGVGDSIAAAENEVWKRINKS